MANITRGVWKNKDNVRGKMFCTNPYDTKYNNTNIKYMPKRNIINKDINININKRDNLLRVERSVMLFP